MNKLVISSAIIILIFIKQIYNYNNINYNINDKYIIYSMRSE